MIDALNIMLAILAFFIVAGLLAQLFEGNDD